MSSKSKWYSRRTANKHSKILARHLQTARNKPITSYAITSTGNADGYLQDDRKPRMIKKDALPVSIAMAGKPLQVLGSRTRPVNYKASSQPVSPMVSSKITRKAGETLRHATKQVIPK